MTTQVVLLNVHGLAFATDSATTFGNGTVYTDATKVSILPGDHKVAVLHAGLVGMHNVTHLSLIEQWMFDLGEGPLPTLAEYAANYLTWLSTTGRAFITDEAAESTIVSAVRRAFTAIASEMQVLLDGEASNFVSTQDIEAACLGKIDEVVDALDRFTEPIGFSPIWADRIMRRLGQRIDQVAIETFSEVPKAPGFGEAVRELAYTVLARSGFTTPATLTFAGYGSDDIAPGVVQLDLGILHSDVLLYRRGEDIHFNRDFAPYLGIVTVGHESTIDLVLHGFNESTIDTAIDAVAGTLAVIGDGVPEGEANDAARSTIHTARDRVPKDVHEYFSEKCWMKRADEILPTLAAMPVPTLAFVAGQFVGLEVLEKILTAANLTVGGEIKVWTITKSDGCRLLQRLGV